MSATELIKQVAALSESEKMLFDELFLAMKNGSRVSKLASQPDWPDFGRRLRGIYGDKITPDSQNIINDGRGDR